MCGDCADFPVTSSGRPTNGPYICLYPFPLDSALSCSTTLGAHAASLPLARAARRPLHSPTGERPREAAREAVKRHSAQSASASRRLELRRTPPPCDGVSSPCRRKDFPFTHSPFASADGSSALPSASAVQRVPPWHRGQAPPPHRRQRVHIIECRLERQHWRQHPPRLAKTCLRHHRRLTFGAV